MCFSSYQLGHIVNQEGIREDRSHISSRGLLIMCPCKHSASGILSFDMNAHIV